MPTAIESFFEQFDTHHYFPRFQDISGSCRLDIEGDGSWLIQVKQGYVNITKDGKKTPADCIVTCSQEDFMRMMQGQLNPISAYLQGRITVTGNIGLAQVCLRMFRLSNNPLAQRVGGEKR
jgi:putative sterol carrier protein